MPNWSRGQGEHWLINDDFVAVGEVRLLPKDERGSMPYRWAVHWPRPDSAFGRSRNLDAARLAVEYNYQQKLDATRQDAPAPEPSHVCGDCGQPLQAVRPGKWQCDNEHCPSKE